MRGRVERQRSMFVASRMADRGDDDLNDWSNLKWKKRSNATRRGVVAPEARLASRGGEAHLSRSRHALTDAPRGLIARVAADGRAERRTALLMFERVECRHRLTPGLFAADACHGAGAFRARWSRAGSRGARGCRRAGSRATAPSAGRPGRGVGVSARRRAERARGCGGSWSGGSARATMLEGWGRGRGSGLRNGSGATRC